MIQANPKKLTFEEYLTYSHENDADERYELIDGELLLLPPESPANDFIAQELFWILAIARLAPRQLIRPHTCELQVTVLQPGDAANRYPDLVVLREEHLTLMQRRLTITLEMPPPRLVVEVVSPGRTNWENDYVRKRAQYAHRGIPEYWIVNPQELRVMVLRLDAGQYVEVGVFSSTQKIVSPTFPDLDLPAAQVFQGIGA
jgi:Uma2 family endonuclease